MPIERRAAGGTSFFNAHTNEVPPAARRFLMPIETRCRWRHVVSMSIKFSGAPEVICMGIKKQGAAGGTSFLWALKNEVPPTARRFYGH